MARKNHFGKFIISASEVGSYVVCPEAWRIQNDGGKPSASDHSQAHQERIEEGRMLHEEWAQKTDDAHYLIKGIRIVVLLVLIAIALLFQTSGRG